VVAAPFAADAFQAYTSALTLTDWRPQFVVLHNTQIPTLAEWHSESGRARMNGFVEYYRDDQGWSAGPHLFVADDVIWVFTPLTTPGVHAPSWNRVAWGVELVGNYDTEVMPDSLRQNAVTALAALHMLGNLDPATLRLHKEDPLTTHKGCPGKAVDKAEFIAAVSALVQSEAGGEHLADRLAGGGGR
jgi:hypothetical protein